MLKFLRYITTPPVAEVIAARDLAEARRQRLSAYAELEHAKLLVHKATANVLLYNERITRLAREAEHVA